MKTFKFKTVPVLITAFAVISLISIASCGSNKGKTENDQNQSAEESVPKPPEMDLHTAAFLNDADVIKQHVAAGSDLNVKEPAVGSSPIIGATVFGKTEAVRALIEGGADLNFQNNEGATALHSAAFLCRIEIVEMLLSNGADKTLRNNAGSTAYESVAGPFEEVKFIYDIFSRDLGPMGLKLDYDYLKETRPKIAEMLK